MSVAAAVRERFSRSATSRSRRRSPVSTRKEWRSPALTAPLSRTLRLGRRLAPERPREDDRADRDGAVGDVERPEAQRARTDVDEVHDAEPVPDAVDEISHRPAAD